LAAEKAAELVLEAHWMSEAIDAAASLPGQAVAPTSGTAARWRDRGTLLSPRFAFVIAWQDSPPQHGALIKPVRRPKDFLS
jgi:hypothetical protein